MSESSRTLEDAEEALIDEYTNCLVDAFTRLKKRIRPDYRNGVRDFTKWRVAAKMLHGFSLDPYTYVQFVFDVMLLNHPDVFVDMVLSPKMIRAFLVEQPKLQEQARLMVELQVRKLKVKLDGGNALKDILLDELNGLMPVFRFATAWSEGLPEIAAKYRESAERTLLFQPVYKELLRPWLPKELQ
jgi:hypothetical protein